MRIIALVFFVLFALSLALNFYLYSQLKMIGLDVEKVQLDMQSKVIERQSPQIQITPPSPIETAFIEKDFPQALALFIEIQATDSEKATEIKLLWFETMRSAIANAKEKQTINPYAELISLFLKEYAYDSYFLFLEITDSLTQDNVTEVLASYLELAQNDLPQDLQVITQNQVSALLRKTVDQLADVGAWDVLTTMLESLLAYAPDNRYLLVNLANAYAQLEQFNLMENTLSYLPQHDKEIQRLRDFQKLRTKSTDDQEIVSTGIKLSRSGDHYMVNAMLEDEDILLMIDTGATTSVLSEELFYNAFYSRYSPEYVGRYIVNTAGGRVRAPIYKFTRLSISEYQVDDIAVIVLPIEGLKADGLLGMNFLREFRFQLDQDNSLLYLWNR